MLTDNSQFPNELVDISGNGNNEVVGSGSSGSNHLSTNGLTNNGGLYVIPSDFVIYKDYGTNE